MLLCILLSREPLAPALGGAYCGTLHGAEYNQAVQTAAPAAGVGAADEMH